MRFRCLSLAAALAAPVPLAAQALPPHAYLPLEHWATPFVEHLIDRGVVKDPTPLTRPWTVGAVVRALGDADSTRLTPAERATVRRIVAGLTPPAGAALATATAEAGLRAATHSRRLEWALREAGPGNVSPQGGFSLGLQFGPGVLFMHPRLEEQLDQDPDFASRDQPLTGRFPEAYGGLRTRYLDFDVGLIQRNWGPPGQPGLLVSNWPLGYDHFFVDVGPSRARVSMLVAQLDALPNNAGDTAQRYFIAHRLRVRPWDWLDLAAWQGTMFTGPDRPLDLWYLTPVRATFETRDQRRQTANVWVGGDGEIRLGRWRVAGSVTLDDIQIFKSGGATDEEPPSLALTATVARPVGPLRVWLGYTLVSNLMYRPVEQAERPYDAVDPARGRPGTGLARNYSDYDELTLRVSGVPLPGVLVSPEVTLLRQGEGDFRLPQPGPSEYATTPTMFAGVVERLFRAAVSATVDVAGYATVEGNAGVHVRSNAGHISGVRDTEFVGGALVRLRLGRSFAVE
jgi:hypothetical protein